MGNKRDPKATRQALLDAAETVFIEKGYGNTALSEIARRAGMTKSLIHHYFGSKENLWREVKQQRFEHYAREQMKMLEESEPNVDLLRNSIKMYFRFLKNNPQIVRIMAWMALEEDHDKGIYKDRELIQAGVARLKEGQESGEVRADIDARFILFTFLGMAQHWIQDREHFIHKFGIEGLPEDLDEAYLLDMLKIVMTGVLPRSDKS